MLKFIFPLLLLASLARGDEIDVKHEKLLYPVVRVMTARSGGSGTVIYSEKRGEGSHRSYILTNWHVVNDAIRVRKVWDSQQKKEIQREESDLVDVEVFSWHGGTIIDKKVVRAGICAYSQEDDIALLELRSNERPYPLPVPNVALLASRAQADLLRVFQEIYVVGCSLGHDPIHSSGDITDLSDLISGKSYMMGSAPLIYGNSGGAVFAKIDGAYFLIGMPARVAVARVAVPNMNWSVPASRIHDFIESHGLYFLTDATKTPEECFKKTKSE